MEKITNLVFEWTAFLRHVVEDDAQIEGRKLRFFTERAEMDGKRWQVWRVWYVTPAATTMFVGDVMLGPVTVWHNTFQNLLRAADLGAGWKLTLEWAELPGEDQPTVLPALVTP